MTPRSLTSLKWHQRYQQQAGWTGQLRHYLYSRIELKPSQRVLEIGCGTGVLLSELLDSYAACAAGIDIDPAALDFARTNLPGCGLSRADAHLLPFRDGCFDVALCHFVLLWLRNPLAALQELARVTRPSGWVLALAEPDYTARIDYPSELAIFGEWQRQSLRRQGADPGIGRRAANLFVQAGLTIVESGIIGAQNRMPADTASLEREWQVLESDLQDDPLHLEQARRLRPHDNAAWRSGARVLFVPTFYVLATVS